MSLARRHGLDLLIVLAAIEAGIEVLLADDLRLPTWLAVPLISGVILTLLARRRLPFAAPAGLWLFAAALSFADGRLVVLSAGLYLAGMVAAFLLGRLRDDVQARLGAAIVVCSATIIVAHDPAHDAAEYILLPVLFGMVWIAGFALRERSMQAEAAEAAARVAAAEERTRIARELHDIVAHSVSVMVLHVGAVRHRLGDDRPEDSEALQAVERTGRTALAEMRQLLAAMSRPGEAAELAPQPGLDGLDAMLHEVRRAGLPVRLRIDGDPLELPPAIDLSAYRIIQEGLTNTLKHAHASQADVLVRDDRDALRIEVRDDGRGPAMRSDPGHGLVGVRERVKI